MAHDIAQPASMERNPYLHGLRGALAFSMFLFHVENSGLPTFDGAVAAAVGFVMASMEHGVELFFGISGIVIVFAFRKSPTPMRFLGNRALRIFPVLWITVTVLALLSNVDPRNPAMPDPLTWLANLFALPPLFPFKLIHRAAWTMSYEFTFYLMFVLFALLSKRLPQGAVIVFIALVGAALLVTHVRAACFVLGVAIAMNAPSADEAATRRTSSDTGPFPIAFALDYSGLWLLASLLAWHACFEMAPGRTGDGLAFIGHPHKIAVFVLAFVCASIGLWGVFLGRGLFARWLLTPTLQWLGTVSFSLYLWQTVTMMLVKGGMLKFGLDRVLGPWSQLAFFAIALVPTLVVSQLSYRWIEDRFTRRLRHWLAPSARRPSVVGAKHGH